MEKPLDFQSIINVLQEYWQEQGCLVWQPYYTQVGAGTMNPATFLRVLGPEPWNVVYVEPSVRPDDGRYGKNPNRMQLHYQTQVILKPDPGNPQELYLESLESLGIVPHLHDIRFVEDNWESPALGAWGLGWEVWLDGLEITQFTYFQQAGRQDLDPVSVEITYGLERIAMALQGVDSFLDIQWDPSLTDGDVNLQAEQEHSKYYFEIADIDRLGQMYDLFEAEAKACLEKGLILPAYDNILKCSHTFNVLDTRGAVGVAERQNFFRRMRNVSRQVAQAYYEQRQRLEFPWIDEEYEDHVNGETSRGKATGQLAEKVQLSTVPAPFLLEIGTEELPVKDLSSALDQLDKNSKSMLAELRLEHGEVQVYGTARRLTVYVETLSPKQSDVEEVVKGPPAERAYDSSGKPTKAAIGFARSKGVAVDDLEIRDLDGGRYVVALTFQAGGYAGELLAERLPDLVESLSFKKSMRWNRSNVAFSRPIRWLLALHGENVVPFEYAGLQSGNVTRGLRFHQPEEIRVSNSSEYFSSLKEQNIILNFSERRSEIQKQIDELMTDVQGEVEPDPALLDEVTNLVETPTALLGSFDKKYLQLPREVLIAVMKKHQRYFPVEHDGELLPYFIVVKNGDGKSLDIVKKGNEHVIHARFADAEYFIQNDLKSSLEEYIYQLGALTFQEDLGSMLDKTHRIEKLVDDLIPLTGIMPVQEKFARRAAQLCKADLATSMVVEMTSLQGVMGRHYAAKSGEPQEVGDAILEHYLPRFAGDAKPQSKIGLIVNLADRLDTLMGLFAAGVIPTGSKDPFAQRRAALGLVHNLIAWKMSFDLHSALEKAAEHLPVSVKSESLISCLDFIVDRLKNLLLEQDHPYDVVDAVLTRQGHNPALAAKSISELEEWVERPDWKQILPAYSRCVRITRDIEEKYPVDTKAFVESVESDLYNELIQAEKAIDDWSSIDEILNAFVPCIATIDRFFDDVLVMAKDPNLQNNRLGLLQRIAALTEKAADFSKLKGF